MDSGDALAQTAGKFPFVMLMTAIFLKGALFLLFNAQVIYLAIQGSRFTSIVSLLTIGILPSWKALITSADAAIVIAGFLFLSLCVGILITPLERFVSSAIVLVVMSVAKMIPGLPKKFCPHLFGSHDFMAPDNAALLSWFLRKPEQRLHWEWTLFLYYVYWSVFFAVMVFSAVAGILLWRSITIWQTTFLLCLPAPFMLFALGWSAAMAQVHIYYRAQMNKGITKGSSGFATRIAFRKRTEPRR
jgi:hypothetical protein